MKWRCGFKFFDKTDPDWATKPYKWRRCDRPWIHLLLPNLKHSGPLITDENHDLGKRVN
jgi:hypothetical protein